MRRFLRIPKIQMIVALLFIYGSFLIHELTWQNLLHLVLSIFFSVFFDLIFLKIKRLNLFFPSAAIVTGLIVGLITPISLPWNEIIIVCFLASLSKQLLRYNQHHIFNPAGLGVFFGSLIFRHEVSWQAVSFQRPVFDNVFLFISFILLFFTGYVSQLKMRRFYNALAFLLVYVLLSRNLLNLLDPTILFFVFVMLPEPMTTPVKKLPQILFGAIVAVFSFFTAHPLIVQTVPIFSLVPDGLIFALLIGNLVFLKYK
ncbi:RnfABCDGE type electron transport complex subunit D [Candidatus Roizmanbacteria bacterium]|nr:RnfABCDGE type electron transport complex subunit D [Candidatus Roizmanbacteria bacterium]